MRVHDRMTADPVCIEADALCLHALDLMHRKRVRRLPVIGPDETLVGIVTEGDLRFLARGAESASRRRVREVMVQEVVTVAPDDALEDAARHLYIDRLRALPVVARGRIVGIITESDIFKVFLQMMGIAEHAVRISVELDDEPGQLHDLTGVIRSHGANIVSLVTVPSPDRAARILVLRVEPPIGGSIDALVGELRDLGYKPGSAHERTPPATRGEDQPPADSTEL